MLQSINCKYFHLLVNGIKYDITVINIPPTTIVIFTTENNEVHIMYRNINVNVIEMFFVLIT